MKKINRLYILDILAGQKFEILISGLYQIRRPGWKKIPKKNKRPGTIIRDRRVGIIYGKHRNLTAEKYVCLELGKS